MDTQHKQGSDQSSKTGDLQQEARETVKMPPKRMAKAKARAGILRRPAGRIRGLRRPSAAEETLAVVAENEEKEKTFAEVKTQDLLNLGPIPLQQATYYGRTVHLASWKSRGQRTRSW